MQALPPQEPIVITASRTPEAEPASAASITQIDAERLKRLSPPLIADILRLAPSLSVATSGPAGSLTEVRIRGAEANHSLLFIDGIRANDPAAGNAPRFELVNADLADRIEVVRGPQSALWGSEAIGGVVAVDGSPAGQGGSANVEAGSFGALRAAANAGIGHGDKGIALGLASQRSAGIDSFSGEGDCDGYRNFAARAAARWQAAPTLMVGASAFSLRGRSQYDGYNPVTYLHDDTLDETRNRLSAARVYAMLGTPAAKATLSASLLGSTNRNRLDGDPINRTDASRATATLQFDRTLGHHQLTLVADADRERFEASDSAYGGATDQRRRRSHAALTAEWKAQIGRLRPSLALRHDVFSRFADATTLRASAVGDLGSGFQLAATYGEGIAQPSFFDLFGFFPGSFAGNALLNPERSRGGEVSLRFRSRQVDLALTAYRQRLSDEIIDVFDPATFLSSTANAAGHSRRRGIEFEGVWKPSPALRLSAAYAGLDASEPTAPGGGQAREQRRARHSGHIAIDGATGRFNYGASLAYNGARRDTDFDQWPARRVRLAPYWLANGRIGYDLGGGVEASVRVANLFDEDYSDVVGYRTEGRSVHAGLRLRFD